MVARIGLPLRWLWRRDGRGILDEQYGVEVDEVPRDCYMESV